MSLLSSDTFKKFGGSNLTYSEFIEGLSKEYLKSNKFTKVELDPNMPELTDKFVHERKYKAGYCQQFIILFERAVLNSVRLFSDEIMRLVTDIVLGLLMIALYYDVTDILIQ